ncbi:hypothetical protein Tco_0915165 [Tanacetum coccineum]
MPGCDTTAVRKAITFLRQAIGSSPGEKTGIAKPESTRVMMDKLMSNVEWDELIHIEMVKTVVEAEDLDLDCVHAEDKLHLNGVRVVQDRHEADQSSLYTNPSLA